MNVPFMDCSYGVKTVAQPLVMVTDKEVVLTARTRHGGRLTSLPDNGSQNLKPLCLPLTVRSISIAGIPAPPGQLRTALKQA